MNPLYLLHHDTIKFYYFDNVTQLQSKMESVSYKKMGLYLSKHWELNLTLTWYTIIFSSEYPNEFSLFNLPVMIVELAV